MEPRLLRIVLVALVIISVVGMSVAPMDHGTGSYQSVNGPTTVFESARAALLFMLMVMTAATVTLNRVVSAERVRATVQSDRSCTMLC